MQAYSDLKMVECSTEAVPQFFYLVIFTAASVLLPRTSGLGLVKEDSFQEWTFVAVSLLLTYHAIISAILGAMDIRKDGQLGFLDKVILGLSFSCQLLAHLVVVVTIGLLALPMTDNPAADGSEDASLSYIHAVLLLFLPLIFRWISVDNLSRSRTLNFRSWILHVLSNTWVTMPVRESQAKQQVHKGTEIRWSLVLAGFNILATWLMTACLIKNVNPSVLPEWPVWHGVQTKFLFPGALASHLAGCSLLLFYYKCCHPWRVLNKWQHVESTRMEINEETPVWEGSEGNEVGNSRI